MGSYPVLWGNDSLEEKTRVGVRFLSKVFVKSLERTICNFIPQLDLLLGVNDDLLYTTDSDDLGRAIRVTGVVDESSAGTRQVRTATRRTVGSKRTQGYPSS